MNARDALDPGGTPVPPEVFHHVEHGRLSVQAAWLYITLLSFLDRTLVEAWVAPSRQDMAERCGLKHARSVDRLLQELQQLGLIITEHQWSEDGGRLPSRHQLMLIVEPENLPIYTSPAPRSLSRPAPKPTRHARWPVSSLLAIRPSSRNGA